MKKKILALLSAAAMTVTALAVPFTASAEEIENENAVVFQSGEETQWRIWENNTKGTGTESATLSNGTDTITNQDRADSPTTYVAGSSITLNMPEGAASSTNPIQVKPVISTPIELKSGVTYSFSLDYTSNITEYTNDKSSDVVYMQAIARYADGKNTTVKKAAITQKKDDDANLGEKSGQITGDLTPTTDGTLELQLYLRNAKGSVNYSNLKVTAQVAPEEAVVEVNGRYFTDVIDALRVVENKGTIELLKTSTLSERAILDKLVNKSAKEITINGNGYTLNAPNNTMAIEVPNGYNLTIKDATVVGGNNYTINVKKGGTLKLDNATIGSTEGNAKPAINIAGTVNATNSSKINSILFESTSNNPVVNLDASSTLTGTIKPRNSTVTITENYELITGNVANCTAVYSNSNDAYKDIELKDGVFVKKPTTPTETITMNAKYKGFFTGDEEENPSTAAAYTATFKSSTGDTTSFKASDIKWTLNEIALEYDIDSSTVNDVKITLEGSAEVSYGIIINDVTEAEVGEGKLEASFN